MEALRLAKATLGFSDMRQSSFRHSPGLPPIEAVLPPSAGGAGGQPRDPLEGTATAIRSHVSQHPSSASFVVRSAFLRLCYRSVADVLLAGVAEDHLDSFGEQERTRFFDCWFLSSDLPATAVLLALAPHISDPSPRDGRLSLESKSASVAAGLFATRFLDSDELGVTQLALEQRGEAVLAEAAGALAAILDRVGPSSRLHPLLRPSPYVLVLTRQFVNLLADHSQRGRSSSASMGSGLDSREWQQLLPSVIGAGDVLEGSFARLFGSLLARLARRGFAMQAALSLRLTLGDLAGSGRHFRTAVPGLWELVLGAVEDPAALEKLLEAILATAEYPVHSPALVAMAASAVQRRGRPLPGGAHQGRPAAEDHPDSLLRQGLAGLLQRRAEVAAFLVSPRLLRRRSLPFPALQLLADLVGGVPAASADASLLHRLSSTVFPAWRSEELLRSSGPAHQSYLSALVVLAMELLGRDGLSDVKGVLNAVLEGISLRLGSPLLVVRRQAFRVANVFSRALAVEADPTPLYEEERPFEMVGVGPPNICPCFALP